MVHRLVTQSFMFQPFLRFWGDVLLRPPAVRQGRVSTLLEILGGPPRVRNVAGAARAVSTLLEILIDDELQPRMALRLGRFQPFLRF